MRGRTGGDPVLLGVTLFLLLLGVVMVYSSSGVLAWQEYQDQWFFLKRQVLFAGLGLVALLVASRVDYRLLFSLSPWFYVLCLGLVFAVFAPGMGVEAGHAKRWLGLGPFSLQPSEFAKLATILLLARMLVRKKEKRGDWTYGYLPLLVCVGLVAFPLLLQPDLGSAVILGLAALILFLVGGVPLRFLGRTSAVVVPGFFLLVLTRDYQWARLTAFRDPWADATKGGFQLVQSLLAFGRGGLLGLGLGGSQQKLFYLPEPHTDFIYSVIGEELGFVGAATVLLSFLVLVWRGIRIAQRAGDEFACYLALGITGLLGLQALINMGVTLGVLPTKGLPLPLISQGGSSVLATMIGIGVLLNVARQAQPRGQTGLARRAESSAVALPAGGGYAQVDKELVSWSGGARSGLR